VIRDTMLAASGLLNLQAGGPGVMPPLPDELVGTLLKGQWKTSDHVGEHWRRSIYIFARRNLRYPLFESFDRPDAGASCAKRDRSTTATQALQMLNSQLSIDCARRLRDRIMEDRSPASHSLTDRDSIDRLFGFALSRRPFGIERDTLANFLGRSDADASASLLAACLAIFNTNEFIYVD
jgi:hypothetical protein